MSLLKKGLNFTVTPNKVPANDYIIGIESACRLLGASSKAEDRLRADCVKVIKHHKVPKSNVSKAEREALKNLAKDDSITILPADKGRAVVVMNTADYKQKATALLSDTTTYQVLKKDPTTGC